MPKRGKKTPRGTVVRGRAQRPPGTAVANPLAGAQGGDDDGVRRQLFREPSTPPPSAAQTVRNILNDPQGAYMNPGRPTPVGAQRSDSASADAVTTGRPAPQPDWNTQFQNTRRAVQQEGDLTRGAINASQAEVLAGVREGTAANRVSMVQSEGRLRQALDRTSDDLSQEIGDAREAATAGLESLEGAVGDAARRAQRDAERTQDAITEGLVGNTAAIDRTAERARRDAKFTRRTMAALADRALEDGELTRQTLRDIDNDTRAALEVQRFTTVDEGDRTRRAMREETDYLRRAVGGVEAAVDDLNRDGTQQRAQIIGELNQQSNDLATAVLTLRQIEAQGQQLSPDALQAATQALEDEPEIQRLVNDGLLKWQDLLRPDRTLDMAKIARIRSMLEQRRMQKENEVQTGYALFNRIETQPGRKSLGRGESLWFPAMWSNTVRA
jgi:hypothetical protein